MNEQQDTTVDELKFVSMATLLEDDQEFEGYNPEADANAGLPPLPKGDYLCIVKYQETDPEKRWPSGKDKEGKYTGQSPVTKEGKKYAYTSVGIELNGNTDPSNDGRLFNGMVNSLVMKNTGTTSIQALLQGCGVEVDELRVANSIKGQVALVDKYLSDGNTIGGVHLDWEASYYRKDLVNPETGKLGWEVFRIRGMKKFPPMRDADGNVIPGKHVPTYPFSHPDIAGVPVNEDLNARNFIHHWVPVDKITGDQVEEEQVIETPVAVAPPAPAVAAGGARRVVPAAGATAPAKAGGPPVPARAGVPARK